MSKTYFNLSEGGAGILQAASRIYAAYVTSGRVPQGKEKEWMRRALKHAMSFAKTIDDLDDSPQNAATPAPIAVGSHDTGDPDDTAVPDEPSGPAEAIDADDSASADDTGIELTATTDEQTISDEEAFTAVLDDQTDSGQDMPLRTGEEFAPAEKRGAGAEEKSRTEEHSPNETSDAATDESGIGLADASDSHAAATANHEPAADDELELDDDVFAALADAPLDSDGSSPRAVDESESAIEFLSAMADDLPPSTDESADMDDIMSALMDGAAEPAGADEPIPIAEEEPDLEGTPTETSNDSKRSKAPIESEKPATADMDEPVGPTEADLATTHLDDDLSFELVDEDIDMNKLIEDAISATEEKEDHQR